MGDAVDVLGRGDTRSLGALHILQRIVIGASLETHLVAALATVPGEHVGLDQLQSVSNMRLAIHVRDRRRHSVATHDTILPPVSAAAPG